MVGHAYLLTFSRVLPHLTEELKTRDNPEMGQASGALLMEGTIITEWGELVMGQLAKKMGKLRCCAPATLINLEMRWRFPVWIWDQVNCISSVDMEQLDMGRFS